MFWKKKQAAVAGGGSGGMGATVSEKDEKQGSHLKIAKPKKQNKLQGPRPLPGFLHKYMVDRYGMDPEIGNLIMIVRRPKPDREGISDCKIFDNAEAEALGVEVYDFDSLKDHPELSLYEGWIDEHSKKAELTEKRKMDYDVPLLTESEILQKIEALKEPGSMVYFYQARGPNVGGPLGRGIAIIELSPEYQKTGKGKKFNIYASNAFQKEPCGSKVMLYGSNKTKEIAKWVKQSHIKRIY